MTDSPYIVGIDLGTSNSALAFHRPNREDESISVLDIEQVESPGSIGRHTVLPSAMYLPHEGEVTPEEVRLPWEETVQTEAVIGVWARERGTQLPERLISSAKSWLCNLHVDRTKPILPWKSEIESGKRSPIDASKAYLSHLRHAFEHACKEQDEVVSLSDCSTIVTVPASFDEVARNLTYDAARAAGLEQVTLLEEPLAAMYSWIGQSAETWRDHVQPGDVVLVCDVGGGTCDFSLVAVTEEDGNLRLERISVGEHLLLGGDNMDLALAYTLKAKLEAEDTQLDHWQFLSLVNSARIAKEQLLTDDSLDELPISIAGRGSSLFAQTISTALKRDVVEAVILDGFFPRTKADELPGPRRSLGIQEFGLGYETEPAVSKHLSRFLHRSLQNVESNQSLQDLVGERLEEGRPYLMPTAVLFNGGVFKAPSLRRRVLDILAHWNDDRPVKELEGANLDLAVAYGATYYGKTRASGKGIRIRSGTARSYYVGLETPMPAVPGIEPPVKGLCLVPQGTEEGSELVLEDQEFGLVVGQPVEFRFFSSTTRAGDGLGTVVGNAGTELEETSRLSITLPADEGQTGELVPVKLDAQVTEVGTLQLYMKHISSDRKWNLEFNVRPHEH